MITSSLYETMETLLPHFNIMSISFSPSTHQLKKSPLVASQPFMFAANGGNEYTCFRVQMKNRETRKLGCGKRGTTPELEDDEIKLEEELIGKEKCRERKNGMVEMLECLEREAIMGDDKGREASDYNRRAHIFYQSSRLFQAIKQRKTKSP